MFNFIGSNMWQDKELKFDFLFASFNIKARVIDNGTYIRIVQILSLRKKKINTKEINVFHPSLEETQASDIQKKKREFINKGNTDKELDTGADGAMKASELTDDFSVTHEYVGIPTINKKKTGLKVNRKVADDNTKRYIVEDDKLRTTADVGGENTNRGLEFTSVSSVEVNGELQEFIEMLRLLEKREGIKSVDIIVDYLPEGTKGKKFSRLKDGVSRRRYLIANIKMESFKDVSIVEIERQDKSLSTLLLNINITLRRNYIYRVLLSDVVSDNGVWKGENLEKIMMLGGTIKKIRHSSNSGANITNRLYNLILSF